MRATMRGLADAIADPAAATQTAIDLVEANGNPSFLSLEGETFRWTTDSASLTTETPAGTGIGIPDPELLQAELDAYAAVGLFGGTAPDAAAVHRRRADHGRLRRRRRHLALLTPDERRSVLRPLTASPHGFSTRSSAALQASRPRRRRIVVDMTLHLDAPARRPGRDHPRRPPIADARPPCARVIAAAYRQYEDASSPRPSTATTWPTCSTPQRHARARRRSSWPTSTATVVGTVCLYLDAARTGFDWPAGTAVVRALAVEPAHRGRGTARRLMDECIERSIDAGAPVVGLHTASVMTAAVRLYERLGFVRDPAHDIDAADADGPRRRRRPARSSPTGSMSAHPIDSYVLGRSDGRDAPADPAAPDLRTDHDRGAHRGRHHAGHARPRPRQRRRRRGVDAGQLVGPEGRSSASTPTRRSSTRRGRGWPRPGGRTSGSSAATSAGSTSAGRLRRRRRALDPDVPRRPGRRDPPGVPACSAPAASSPSSRAATSPRPLRTHPPMPVHDDVIRWMTPPAGRADARRSDMGMRLHRTFLDAGLPAPQLRQEAPIGGGPTWPGYTYVAETARSLLPMLVQLGAVTAAEADIDTLGRPPAGRGRRRRRRPGAARPSSAPGPGRPETPGRDGKSGAGAGIIVR